jgi:hypothetical protein
MRVFVQIPYGIGASLPRVLRGFDLYNSLSSLSVCIILRFLARRNIKTRFAII